MVASCVICLGSSGQALAGKRCRASRCKAEYAARIKLAKAAAGGGSSTATSPTASAGAARSSAELESLVALKLWEMFGIYGRREYDPDTLTSYEIRNGISADREKELAYLVYASWKEDANDVGRSTNGGYDTVRKHVSCRLLQPSPRAQNSVRPHGLARRSTLARKRKRPAAGKLEPLRASIQPPLHPA